MYLIQKLQEICSSTLSKILKTLNAHNFLNIYRNILKLGAQNIRIDSRNPTEEEFLQFHLNQFSQLLKNDEHLDIFDSDSLHNLLK